MEGGRAEAEGENRMGGPRWRRAEKTIQCIFLTGLVFLWSHVSLFIPVFSLSFENVDTPCLT